MASSATSSASSAPSSSGQPLTTTKTIVTTTTTTTAATAVHSGGGRGGGANLATSGVPVARSPSPRPVPPHKPLPHPSLDESIRAITIPAAQVQVDRTSILGKGSFGVAYKATYVSTQVAVKELLTPVLSPQVREELAREISTLKSSLHPNIIRFYGLIRDRQDGPYAIVVEYASFGSLFDFYIRNPKESVTLDGRIELLYQTAAGLAYLHDHLGIIHRDVKSPNVLLTKDPESQGIMAKISDFGLATLKNEAAVISKDSKPVGTLLWMAPETMDLLNSTSTRKSDVFSYAVVMTEVLGWVGVYGLPWRSMPRPTVVVNTITDPVRRQTIFDKMCMTVFNKAPDGILDLFEKCWDLKPENRPEFSEIVAVLQSVLRELDAQSGSPRNQRLSYAGSPRLRDSGLLASGLGSMDFFDFADTEPFLESVNPVRSSGEEHKEHNHLGAILIGGSSASLGLAEYAQTNVATTTKRFSPFSIFNRTRKSSEAAAAAKPAKPAPPPVIEEPTPPIRIPASFFGNQASPPRSPNIPSRSPTPSPQPPDGDPSAAHPSALDFWVKNFGNAGQSVSVPTLLGALKASMDPSAAARWNEAMERQLATMLGKDDGGAWSETASGVKRGGGTVRRSESSASRWKYAMTAYGDEGEQLLNGDGAVAVGGGVDAADEDGDKVSLPELTGLMQLRGDQDVKGMVEAVMVTVEKMPAAAEAAAAAGRMPISLLARHGSSSSNASVSSGYSSYFGIAARRQQQQQALADSDSDAMQHPSLGRTIRTIPVCVEEGSDAAGAGAMGVGAPIVLPAGTLSAEPAAMEAAAHGPPAATATANEVFLEAAAHLARESFDESRALFVYNAKTNNHAESMYVLGQLWETGHGVPAADVDVARGWYRKASDLGNDKAAKRLRDMNAVTFPFLAMMRGQNVDVDIKMERLNDVMVAAIADELSGNNHVVSLRLASDRPTNQIDDTDVMALAKALRKNTHLKELHLCGHRITNSGANSLASAIMVNSTLQLLDLSNNRIGSHGARALAQALLTDGVAVKSLNLRCNRIGNAGAEDFAETFHENKVLQKLDLSLNQITSIGASAFGKALGKCSLHEFIIAENQIDDRGAEQIAQGLESGSCALTVLSMRANSIGAAGAEAFARLLKVNNVLQELDLAHNSIQDAGAKALALGLESNESLLILDIAENKIGDDGGAALVTLLKKNHALTRLVLTDNLITGLDVYGYGYGTANALTRAGRERKVAVAVGRSRRPGIVGGGAPPLFLTVLGLGCCWPNLWAGAAPASA